MFVQGCGARRSNPETGAPAGPRTEEAPPSVSSASALEDVFVVEVSRDGRIFLAGGEVTRGQLEQEALSWVMDHSEPRAILFVSSSQMQGIQLTALLSEVGFSNVTVYYPTATVH
jgi:biopolymer transport protein ExbD